MYIQGRIYFRDFGSQFDYEVCLGGKCPVRDKKVDWESGRMEIIWGTASQLTPHPVLSCTPPPHLPVCPIQSNCDAGNLVSLPVRAGDIAHIDRHIGSHDAGIRAFGFDEAVLGVPLVRGAGVGAVLVTNPLHRRRHQRRMTYYRSISPFVLPTSLVGLVW